MSSLRFAGVHLIPPNPAAAFFFTLNVLYSEKKRDNQLCPLAPLGTKATTPGAITHFLFAKKKKEKKRRKWPAETVASGHSKEEEKRSILGAQPGSRRQRQQWIHVNPPSSPSLEKKGIIYSPGVLLSPPVQFPSSLPLCPSSFLLDQQSAPFPFSRSTQRRK